jgi:hypothetical protein
VVPVVEYIITGFVPTENNTVFVPIFNSVFVVANDPDAEVIDI